MPIFKSDRTFKAGDVGNIFASVKQVYQYQIDEAELSRAASRYTAQQLRDACTEMESRADGGKLRPCLVLGDPVRPGKGPQTVASGTPKLPPVALFATFGSANIDKFPRGVRHHLVPIYTKGSNLGNYEHLHTTPNWDGRSPQYAIAYEYIPLEHKVIEHYKSARSDTMPNGTHYSVEPRALSDFRYLCTSRTQIWQSLPQAEKKKDAKALLKWRPPKDTNPWDARTFATAAPDFSRDISSAVSPARSVRQVVFDADGTRRNANSGGSSSPLASSFSAVPAESESSHVKHNRLSSVTETEWTTVEPKCKGRTPHSPTTASQDTASTMSSRWSIANAKSASSAIDRRTHRQTMSLPDDASVDGKRSSPRRSSFKPWKRSIGGNNTSSIDSVENWRSGHTPKSRSDNLMDINKKITASLVQQSKQPDPGSEVQSDGTHLKTPIQQLSTEPPAIEASLEVVDRDSKRLSAASEIVAPSDASSTVGSTPVFPLSLNSDSGYLPEKGPQRTTVLPTLSPQPAVLVELPQPITAPRMANDAAAFPDTKKSGMLTRVANTFSRKAKRQVAKARTEALAR